MSTRHSLAVLHNDDSVLERFHISSAFQVMTKPGHDALSWLSPDVALEVRQTMIDLVLATVCPPYLVSLRFPVSFIVDSIVVASPLRTYLSTEIS